MLVNDNIFKLKEVPQFNPITQRFERVSWWKQEKRKCIEGLWVSGKWMPGPLYYYINFHKIQVEDENVKGQILVLPWLRDIDWEIFYIYEECRGFSGFSEDLEYTCDRRYGPEKEKALKYKRITVEEVAKKKYIPAREYLRKNHGKNLGKPLYKNSSKHLISIQSRGGGKSYASSGIAAHNFLFDGAVDYDAYLESRKNKTPMASDTIISAIDTKYTEPLLKKIFDAMSEMEGKEVVGAGKDRKIFPSPLLHTYTGSVHSDKREIVASSSSSVLRHRTFSNNPLAANGSRANLVVIDEIGFMDNINEAWSAIEGIQQSKQIKSLVIWALGTGGLVSGQAARHAESIFRNPEQYNCLHFDDIFENKGKIGYFVPYTKTLNEFKKDVNGTLVTNEELALEYVKDRREEKKKASEISAYYGEIINGPIFPSEAFLSIEGSYFPTLLLKEQLSQLEAGDLKIYTEASFKGELKFKDSGELEFISIQDIMPLRQFPLAKNANKEGCIEIWQKPQTSPDGSIPYGLYIAGIDVVDKAISTTDSLPCILVMNRLTRTIVAEYTGRTENPKDFYERCRKLLIYYNAVGMYEQNLTGLYTHFEQNKCLHLLADTPNQLRNRETFKVGTNTSKGVVASTRTNEVGRQFVKAWLLQPESEINPDKKLLNFIYSPAIVKELIQWNIKGNFDRVSALIMLMWFDETSRVSADMFKKEDEVKTFLDHDYFQELGVLTKRKIGERPAFGPFKDEPEKERIFDIKDVQN